MDKDTQNISKNLDFIIEHMATKENVVKLRTEVKKDIGDLRTEVKKDIGKLRTEVKKDTVKLRTEVKKDIGDLRTEVKKDIGELRMELKGDIIELRTELTGEIDSVNASIGGLKMDIAELKVGLKSVESKVSGIDKRLDIESGHRDDLKIPLRVIDLETKVFGKSREPEVSV